MKMWDRRGQEGSISCKHVPICECVNWVHTCTGAYERRGLCTQDGEILPTRPSQEPEGYSPPLG